MHPAFAAKSCPKFTRLDVNLKTVPCLNLVLNRTFALTLTYLAGARRAVVNLGKVVLELVRPLLLCPRVDAGELCGG